MYITLNTIAPDVFEFHNAVFSLDFSKSFSHTLRTVSDTKAAELGSQYPPLQTALHYRRSKVGELPINFELFDHLVCLCCCMFQIYTFCCRFSVIHFLLAAQGRGFSV
jgi:hypothetical protein